MPCVSSTDEILNVVYYVQNPSFLFFLKGSLNDNLAIVVAYIKKLQEVFARFRFHDFS